MNTKIYFDADHFQELPVFLQSLQPSSALVIEADLTEQQIVEIEEHFKEENSGGGKGAVLPIRSF